MTVSYTHLDVYKRQSEVRAMSVAELNTKLDALKKDLFMLRMQLSLIHI